jgi:hypothetical protein
MRLLMSIEDSARRSPVVGPRGRRGRRGRSFAVNSAIAALVCVSAGAVPVAGQEAGPTAVPTEGRKVGVAVSYRLPTDGPLPATYRVTLAIVDAKNPDWIISQFAAGVVRTVTAENGGRFTETWDGLDDNFMPVPPGDYAVRGICAPARKWAVDGDWHAITPRFHSGASSWMPEDDRKTEPFGGDPVNAPLGDVTVGPDGIAVFYWEYLENGTNLPMLDLKKPIGYGQVLRSFPSGGAGGGTAVATDGRTVWAFSTDGGPKYVYRADGKPFGRSDGANRNNCYLPEGWVTAMAAHRDAAAGRSFVYVAQRGRIESVGRRDFRESDKDFADKVTVHDGENGKVLAERPLRRPRGLVARGGRLYALHGDGDGDGGGFAVSVTTLAAGLPGETWERLFAVPASVDPAGFAVDARERVYLSEPAANKVRQFDRTGRLLRSFGKADPQKPGTYDPDTFMSPGKLATWTDPDGRERLLVIENAGPNRVSEWSDEGVRLRDFLTLQTKANDGYAVDPEHPRHVYIPGQRDTVVRFLVDYDRRNWTVDAVWPLEADRATAGGLDKPVLIRAGGRMCLAGCAQSHAGRDRGVSAYNVYRLDAGGWKRSAAILSRRAGKPGTPPETFLGRDADGDGKISEAELVPTPVPAGMFSYHGQNWAEGPTFLGMALGGRDVWRLSPEGFDPHGNPMFRGWRKTLTDPVFEARKAGKVDSVHGGNELADSFSSDWMQADGDPESGYYVQARGGPSFSANEGSQYKVSRYVPDGSGGFRLKWRTGRATLGRTAAPGEIYGAMRIRRPINGLIPVVDQSRCGIVLYTEDGLYVDTLFPDVRRTHAGLGMYALPGEFFAGTTFPNRDNGRIYFALGKVTPLFFEAEGWSLKENPVRPLPEVQKSVSIGAAQIADPPEAALKLRGGAGRAKVARFSPAMGTSPVDAAWDGWRNCDPVVFGADADHTVEVRCLYRPEELLLRWHARLGSKFAAKPLAAPERLFTHDRGADTLSFYIQGDPDARPGGADGRPGDARFVFGLIAEGETVKPVGIGMYPEWTGPGPAIPQVYRTPVGRDAFAHVGPIAGARYTHSVDPDGKGFVLTAALPRAAIPRLSKPFDGAFRTRVNFEATFAGHNKFWWSDADASASRETYDEPSEARLYPGAWSPALFEGLDGGVTARHWMVCGPFGGPGAENFSRDPNGRLKGTDKPMKDAVRDFCESAAYPPDTERPDPKAAYRGEAVRGYWPDPREVRWKPAGIEPLDVRVRLGDGGQVWYAATWVHVPEDRKVECVLHGSPMSTLRWFLNGERLTPAAGPKDTHTQRATLSLKRGWNEVKLRGYCVGYPPFRAGLVLTGSPKDLWSLELSGTPPPNPQGTVTAQPGR